MAGDSKTTPKVKVAIIGGGCAGMAAAWELAKHEGYEIHVYEKSWRLGGKGASVRTPDGRILEHGLHVWMGFYENAFRMMRECYDEVGEQGWGPGATGRGRLTHGRFDEAFLPEPHVGVFDPRFFGEQVVWSGFFPPTEDEPGKPIDQWSNPFTIANYMTRAFDLAKTLMLSVVGTLPDKAPGTPRPDERSPADEVLSVDIKTGPGDATAALLERMSKLTKAGALTSAAALLQAFTMLEVWLRRQESTPDGPESALALAEAVASQVRKALRDAVSVDPQLRMKTEIIDIVMTVMVGLFADRVMFKPEGLDSINHLDYREWLKLHGATTTALKSRFITGAYDFAFAYEDGDAKKPRLAAGVALRGAFRMFFTYRGAMVWRMASGMGDAVFAPLYAVLHAGRTPSKVHFHFLHDLQKVTYTPAEAGKTTAKPSEAEGEPEPSQMVAQLSFRRPSTKKPHGVYALDSNGCWPATADHVLRQHDSRGGYEDVDLKRGEHFDAVIVATGVHEFSTAFVEKGANLHNVIKARWADMAAHVKTVPTKAGQVWLSKSLDDLGWSRGPGIYTALGEGFDAYADMTHILASEAWAAPKPATPKPTSPRPAPAAQAAVATEGDADPPQVQSLAYFCGVLAQAEVDEALATKDPDAALEAKVGQDLDTVMRKTMAKVWPHLGSAEMRRHVQANHAGSERYTLSLPGSLAARISPLKVEVKNMTVAGDWTACGLDCGCVEAAVMSGLLAAAAISGHPDLEDIVGYDHP